MKINLNKKRKAVLLGKRLFDPRFGKFRKPGNNNPGLIFYDLLKIYGIKITPELTAYTKRMANYCDEELKYKPCKPTQKRRKT